MRIDTPAYRIQLDVVSDGWDGQECWMHPRAGSIPGDHPEVVMTVQKWAIKQSDLFRPLQSMWTRNWGQTWHGPTLHADTLGERKEADGVVLVCDFTSKWHAKTRSLLGIGHTVRYLNDKLVKVRRRETAYAVYNPRKRDWSNWAVLEMPSDPRFANAGAGCVQRVDRPNGEILLPVYFKPLETEIYSTTVLRCRFDGQKLEYRGHGTELSLPAGRGLYEPSLAEFQGRFFLTLRNDTAAYVAVSKDGMHFSSPVEWKFDTGQSLGSYNTQAHWVTHPKGLFLTYTRRGANNDSVIRHRAPLFIAQVDTNRLMVLRETERILVPNTGAQLGNYGVCEVNAGETWVTTSEGMAPRGNGPYSANGRVYAARIQWAE